MNTPASALLMKGFRPFFLGATVIALLSMTLWMASYLFQIPVAMEGISAFQWHAHEMIFGYAMAVIAGFLLTAARNWTGEETATGTPLAVIFLLWAFARLMMMGGTAFLTLAATADLLFMLALSIVIARPVLKVRQKRQAPVLVLLALLTTTNAVFYLGSAGVIAQGAEYGVYGGLYSVLGLVLFMGRRVIPFFTERGLQPAEELDNARWNDIATFVLYPLFALSELFYPYSLPGAALAGTLFLLNSLRVNAWHRLGIWQKPLIWGLFAAFLMINLGFLLRGLMPVTAIPAYLHIHAFALGGIGIISVSMMARVTLGHTGRNVHEAPRVMTWVLVCMVLSTFVRLFFPLMDASLYSTWIGIAAAFWLAGFGLFAITFVPMLIAPRVDGKPG